MVRMINRAWSEKRYNNGTRDGPEDDALLAARQDSPRPSQRSPSIPKSPSSSSSSNKVVVRRTETHTEMHAEMEREYMNLIASLETEKRRVVDQLKTSTDEKDRIQDEVARLQRELQETKSAASHMSTLEKDLERFKVAVQQRDDLIGARNEELEGLRKVVNMVSEEKADIEEKSKEDKERQDSIQSMKVQLLFATLAEKEALIKAKDEEIETIHSQLCNRKKERDDLRQEVELLQIDLEAEQREIEDLKKSMGGYRLELRRLNAIAEEQRDEDQDATRKVDEIQSALDQETENNKALGREVDQLTMQLDQEADRTSTLMSEVAGLKSELDRARESIPEEVQQELTTQKSKIEDLEVALSQKDLDIEAKVGKLAKIQEELAKSTETSTSLRKDLKETKARLEQELGRVDKARAQAEKSGTEELQALQDELAKTKTLLQDQKDLAEDLQMQVSFMEEEGTTSSKDHEEELRAVREVLEETKAQLQDKSVLAQSLQARIDSMKSEESTTAQRYDDESSTLRHELEETKTKLLVETDQAKQLLEQITQMKTESINQRVDAQIEADALLKESHQDAIRQLDASKKDNASLRTSSAEKDAAIEAKSLECDSMKSLLKAVEEETEVLTNDLKRTKEELRSQDTPVRTNSWRRLGSQKNLVDYESSIAEKDKCIEDKSEEVRTLMTDLQKCVEEREAMSEQLGQLKVQMESKTNELAEAEQKALDETKQIKGKLAETVETNTFLKKEVTDLKDQLVSESMNAYKMRKELELLSNLHESKSSGESQQSLTENIPGVVTVGNNPEAESIKSTLEKETERRRLRMLRIRERAAGADSDQSQSFALGRNKDVDELKTEVGKLRTENESLRWEVASNDLKACDSEARVNEHLLKDQKLSSMEASLEEKEAQLEEKASQMTALETQIKALEESSANQTDREELVDKLAGYESRVDGLEKDLADRDSVVDVKNQEIKGLQSTLETCTKEKEDLDNEICELKSRLEAESTRNVQLADAEKRALKKIEELETDIEEREEEIASLAMGGAETESNLNELNALKEQLVDESRRAHHLSKEVESLQLQNNKALEEIGILEDDVAEKQCYIDSQCKDPHKAEENLAQIEQENEALKLELESASFRLKQLSAQNTSLKKEVDLVRRKDINEGRTSAVFRARSQPWANSAMSKREVRDESSEGDLRSDCSSQESRNASEPSAEIDSLRKALHDAKREKADLSEAVRSREKYVDELEFKRTEYSKKIAELKRSLAARSEPGPEDFRPEGSAQNLQKALSLKEKEVERLHKDMVSLKMLASSKFRELESKAARAMDHEEQSQALRVAMEKMKAAHRDEIEDLKMQQLACTSRTDGLRESKGARESKLQHKYEQAIKKANDEKDMMRKDIVALTTERRAFLDKIKSLEQTGVSSNSVPLKMMRSENDALKLEVDKLNKERKRMKGKLCDYDLI